MGAELTKIFNAAFSTGHLTRFIVFGSFVTAKEKPNDIDIFLMMDDKFEISEAAEYSKNLFHHRMAQITFGASVFWLRRKAALEGEDRMIENWQIKRDGTRRGIIEITTHPK
ncbi:MAG: hypothetical protein P1U58_10960 [Verrucomicrobiales bacterium]|nr:hypothetical protein [Verrucomicrobiales bacterium]